MKKIEIQSNEKSLFGRALLSLAVFMTSASVFLICYYFKTYSDIVNIKVMIKFKEKEIKDLKEKNMQAAVMYTELTSLSNMEEFDGDKGFVVVDSREVKYIKSHKNNSLSKR